MQYQCSVELSLFVYQIKKTSYMLVQIQTPHMPVDVEYMYSIVKSEICVAFWSHTMFYELNFYLWIRTSYALFYCSMYNYNLILSVILCIFESLFLAQTMFTLFWTSLCFDNNVYESCQKRIWIRIIWHKFKPPTPTPNSEKISWYMLRLYQLQKNNVFIYFFLFTSVAHFYRYLYRFFISK